MQGTEANRYSPIEKQISGIYNVDAVIHADSSLPMQTASLVGGYGNYSIRFSVLRIHEFKVTNRVSGADIRDFVQMSAYLVESSCRLCERGWKLCFIVYTTIDTTST